MSKKQETEVVNAGQDENVEGSFSSKADILSVYAQVLLHFQSKQAVRQMSLRLREKRANLRGRVLCGTQRGPAGAYPVKQVPPECK